MSTLVSLVVDCVHDSGSLVGSTAIYMCADSAGTYSNGTLASTTKVYDGGNYLMGACGDYTTFLSMCYDFYLPPNMGLSKREYIRGPLRDAVRSALSSDEERKSYSVHLGFYYNGEPCLIEIGESPECMEEVTRIGYVCSGSGREIAIGALVALRDGVKEPSDVPSMLEKVLSICGTYNAYTRPPYVTLTLPQPLEKP